MRRNRVKLLVTAACVLCACGTPSERDAQSRTNANAGLYSPGSSLGVVEMQETSMGVGERCVAPGASAADAGVAGGMLAVEYSTQTVEGFRAPANCSAVWVETMDGRYVATLELTAGLRRPDLVYWQERACIEELGPDAMTSATRRDHARPHSASWTGVDFEGTPMPDGSYKLMVEVTETDLEPGYLSEFEFVKGQPGVVEGLVDVDGLLFEISWEWQDDS